MASTSEHILLDSDEENEINSSAKAEVKGETENTKEPRVIQTGKKRQRRLTSSVWVHYDSLDKLDKDGNLICKCKKCGVTYNADSKNGTGNLIRHVKNCKMRTFKDVGQMLLSKTSSGLELRMPKFNADDFRELLQLLDMICHFNLLNMMG